MEVLIVLSRWLHVVAAALVIGGLFFMRVLLPLGLAQADATSREAVFLRCRRAYKMVVHPSILIFILTGIYNSSLAWDVYKTARPLGHAFWGTHVFLGALAIVISLAALAPKQPPKWHKTAAAANLVILFLAVAAASSLKYVRENAIRNHPTTAPARSPG